MQPAAGLGPALTGRHVVQEARGELEGQRSGAWIRTARSVDNAGAFATLAPMVRDYLRERAFERTVDLDDKVVLRRLAENDAQQIVIGAFGEMIRGLAVEQREATIEESAMRVSDTPPFPWSRDTVEARRTVFNLTPVDNRFERRFAEFLGRELCRRCL